MEHIGTITEHSIEEGKKGNYHKITVEPEKWGYNIFDIKLFDLCKKDRHIKVIYEINGKYRDVKSIEEVPGSATVQSDSMSKADWERKDRATWRCGLAKSFIEILGDERDWTPEIEAAADRAFAWVMELPEQSRTVPVRTIIKSVDLSLGQFNQVATLQPAAGKAGVALEGGKAPLQKPDLGQRKTQLQTDLYAQGYKNAAEVKQFLANPAHGFEHTSLGQFNEAEVDRLEELLAKFPKQKKLE